MTKNRAPTPVYLDPGMHSGLEVKGLINQFSLGDFQRYTDFRLDHVALTI